MMRSRVSVELRIGLDREASLPAVLSRTKIGSRSLAPRIAISSFSFQVISSSVQVGFSDDELDDSVAPKVHLLCQHLADDGGVARRADSSPFDRVGQLLDRA